MSLEGMEEEVRRVKRLMRVGRKAMRQSADKLLAQHRSFVRRGITPSRRAQKRNAPKYAKRKKGRPPLHKTGRLKEPKNWRFTEKKNYIFLRPPADRDQAVAIMEKAGFVLITTRIPPKIMKEMQMDLEKAMKAAGGESDFTIKRRKVG